MEVQASCLPFFTKADKKNSVPKAEMSSGGHFHDDEKLIACYGPETAR
jgi:hypothetical protein